VFTVNQVRAILKAFAGKKPWELFFTLLATSGLRASEILGLRVEDLDFIGDHGLAGRTIWPSAKNFALDGFEVFYVNCRRRFENHRCKSNLAAYPFVSA
jgi:site-specific recombinase XerD